MSSTDRAVDWFRREHDFIYSRAVTLEYICDYLLHQGLTLVEQRRTPSAHYLPPAVILVQQNLAPLVKVFHLVHEFGHHLVACGRCAPGDPEAFCNRIGRLVAINLMDYK